MQYVFWGSTHVQAKPFGATLSFDKLDNLSSLCFDISYLQNSSVYHKHFKLCEAYLVCKEQIYITLCKLYYILIKRLYICNEKGLQESSYFGNFTSLCGSLMIYQTVLIASYVVKIGLLSRVTKTSLLNKFFSIVRI